MAKESITLAALKRDCQGPQATEILMGHPYTDQLVKVPAELVGEFLLFVRSQKIPSMYHRTLRRDGSLYNLTKKQCETNEKARHLRDGLFYWLHEKGVYIEAIETLLRHST